MNKIVYLLILLIYGCSSPPYGNEEEYRIWREKNSYKVKVTDQFGNPLRNIRIVENYPWIPVEYFTDSLGIAKIADSGRSKLIIYVIPDKYKSVVRLSIDTGKSETSPINNAVIDTTIKRRQLFSSDEALDFAKRVGIDSTMNFIPISIGALGSIDSTLAIELAKLKIKSSRGKVLFDNVLLICDRFTDPELGNLLLDHFAGLPVPDPKDELITDKFRLIYDEWRYASDQIIVLQRFNPDGLANVILDKYIKWREIEEYYQNIISNYGWWPKIKRLYHGSSRDQLNQHFSKRIANQLRRALLYNYEGILENDSLDKVGRRLWEIQKETYQDDWYVLKLKKSYKGDIIEVENINTFEDLVIHDEDRFFNQFEGMQYPVFTIGNIGYFWTRRGAYGTLHFIEIVDSTHIKISAIIAYVV